MNQDQKERSGPETLLAAWMKAGAEFWGSMMKMLPSTPEMLAPSEEAIKSRPQEVLKSTMKMWQSLFSTLSEQEGMDTLFKGIHTLPEIVLKMAKTGWDGYFDLQRLWFEKAGKIGKHTEAYKFEDLSQSVFKIWTEIYEKEFKQFITVPQLGLTRFYQERVREAVNKFNLFQAKIAEFFYLLYLPMENSLKVMQEKLEELTKEGKIPTSPQEYYQMWLKILEGHYMTLFKSPEYAQVLGNTLNAMEEFTLARQKFLQDLMQMFPAPTYKDIDDLSKEIYELKKRVKEMAEKVDKLYSS